MLNEIKTPDQHLRFSDNIKNIVKGMMGLSINPVSIKGKKKQVDTLVKTLLQEKRFLEKYQEHGPDHPRTKKEKVVLDQRVEAFENLMGIEWPLR
tara:strand:+ start:619 stop:903 length:285 start_codon:yes stop_codon:yes gene_type:complete